MKRFFQLLIRIINSTKFFVATLVIFIIQAVWLALISVYPMAFDENFHYGIIAIYAKQWSPILTAQPENPGVYGELLHDPSYLYHYLMSFPYRITDALFHNDIINIISIRLIDVALFTVGLIAFRKLMMRFGASRALTHASLFIFALVPVTTFLAGQMNYDNLIFFATPFLLWFTFNVVESIKKHAKVSAADIVAVLSIGMLTSLVKYAFLPIFVACVVCTLFVWIRSKKRKNILRSFGTSFGTLSRKTQIVFAIIFVVSTGLFLQRYGYNAIAYQYVQPDCAEVLTIEQCKQYGPWARNYRMEEEAKITHSNLEAPGRNPIVYMRGWIHAMIYRLYFSINYDYRDNWPLPLPFAAAFIFGIGGLILSIVFIRSIFRAYKYAWLLVSVIFVYSLSLIALNYSEYLRFGEMVAVNGRYLIPILPLVFILFGFAYHQLFRRIVPNHVMTAKVSLFIVLCLLTLNGGGITGFLINSDASWYWANSPLAGINVWLGDALRPMVLMSISDQISHFIRDFPR